jgi:hypothetical protein
VKNRSLTLNEKRLDLIEMFFSRFFKQSQPERLRQRGFDTVKHCVRPADLYPFRAMVRV